ncbi:MAG: T9SS type A sorting domain-containing protein [Bacteroidales bacterium]|nr:T9SS type A sorting domain-containing protein [Bacteroidales bacterium]
MITQKIVKRTIILLSFIFISVASRPQALPIYIDGTYDDWENAIYFQEDEQLSGEEIDFLKFTVANDNDFLFIKIDFSNEIDLTENNEIYLDIDADNDPATGWQINGIGSEMDWNFGQRFGYLNEGSSWEYINFSDIQLRVLPTVTCTSFEIAIGRHVRPNGIDYLFTGDTIKLCFTNYVTNGDNIPNQGELFTYIFDNTNVEPAVPIFIQKEDDDLLRLMAYNIRNDFENNIGGLDDPQRLPGLARIFTAIAPDIITINECWNTTISTALNFLNTNLPTGNIEGWYANKNDGANITASRHPIIQSWLVHPERRITACLIDLPDIFKQDILVISAHFSCCDNDITRQMEADAFVSFMLDAKTQGGNIDLPENTPFILMGDLNLVGLSQQLTTLLYGDIQDTLTFGPAAPIDWDNSDLEDLISRQTDKRMAYTWRNDEGSYPPGRLDYMIFSNSVTDIEKAFTLQTEVMPQERLDLYGLEESDTRNSSDHFPKVADFILEKSSNIETIHKQEFKLEIYPNPATECIYIKSDQQIIFIKIYNYSGRFIHTEKVNDKNFRMNSSHLENGIYLLQLKIKDRTIFKRIIVE